MENVKRDKKEKEVVVVEVLNNTCSKCSGSWK